MQRIQRKQSNPQRAGTQLTDQILHKIYKSQNIRINRTHNPTMQHQKEPTF